jgi:hypothetical protein
MFVFHIGKNLTSTLADGKSGNDEAIMHIESKKEDKCGR